MRTYLYGYFISFIMISCGGSKSEPEIVEMPDNEEPQSQVNKEPSIPELEHPTKDLLCTENDLEFKWLASTDPEGDAIIYEIEIATDELFENIVHTEQVTDLTNTVLVNKGIAYYWRVRAIDNNDKKSEFSEASRFYTEGDPTTNQLPDIPSITNPTLDATLIAGEVLLEWSATDKDGDNLLFDIYFGTENNLELLVDQHQEASYSVNLIAGTYSWKIIVKDDKGGAAVGPVWYFTVE